MALIKITSFAKAKNNGSSNGSNSNSKGFTTTIKKDLDMHYLWGQPFNGTQDVNGDMDVKGNVTIDGKIKVENIDVNGDIHVDGKVISKTIKTETIDADNGNFKTVNSHNINTLSLNSTNAEIENLISKNAEINNLNVNVLNAKQAHFWELIIDKMKSTNGSFILSPANAKIEKIITNPKQRKFQLMWRTTDLNTNKAISNDFEVDDQIISISFNQADAGNNYNISNKYYWAKVLSKGTMPAYDDLRKITCDWHYIVIGGFNKTWDGILTPEVGDEICVLGNTTNKDRQNAIILSSTNSTFLDEDLEAPSIAQYKGIKTFELRPYRMNVLSSNNNTFYGNFNVIVGDETSDVKDLINDSKSNIASIETDSLHTFIMADSNGKITSINAATGLVKKIKLYLGNNLIPTSEFQTSSYIQWRGTKFFPINDNPNIGNAPILRDGIDINNFQINPNDIAINWTYHGTVNMFNPNIETTPSDTECIIYIKFIHKGKTYEKNFTVPAKVIKTEKGTDAEFDNLIIDQFEATVTIEDKLKISGTGYIQNIKGNNIKKITSLNDYVLEAVSNAGDKFTFNKSTYFYYSNNNYVSNYSKQNKKQNYFTIRLFKNGTKIDEKVFDVNFDSGAIFQVKKDAITSAVQSSKNYTDGEITSVNTNLSRIEQTANQISSRVTNIENDYVTSSELRQTADNIQLNVYDNLNEKTGIDVRNGQITLNAKNTKIQGNLNLYDADNGLTVFDHDGVARINVQPKKIDEITEDINDAIIPYNYVYSNINASSWNATSSTYNITLKKGDSLDIRRIAVQIYAQNTSGQNNYPSGHYMYGNLKVIKPDNAIKTFDLVLQGKGDGLYRQIIKETLNTDATGTYKFVFNVHVTSSYINSYKKLYAHISCLYDIAQVKQTYIGINGLFSHTGASKQVYFGEDKNLLQFGANGIRWTEKIINGSTITGNKSMDVAVNYSSSNPSKVVWMPFYNYTPIFKPSTWQRGEIINTGHMDKYYYKIDVQNDRGICVLETAPTDTNGHIKDAWILLPNEVIDDGDGNIGGYLPVGYILTIINHTFLSGNKCNLYVTGDASQKNEVVIIDSNRNQNYYCNLSGTQSSDTYIYMGSYTSNSGKMTMYWQSLHDTQ
ncbi:polymer-forming cytoskeletal protein [Prevotella koreensis]